MTCGTCRDKFTDYLEHALTDQDLRELEAHLGECDACAQDLAAFRTTVGALQGMERARPPDGLLQQINQAIDAAGAQDAASSPENGVTAIRRRWSWQRAGALALAACALVGFVAILRNSPGTAPQWRGEVGGDPGAVETAQAPREGAAAKSHAAAPAAEADEPLALAEDASEKLATAGTSSRRTEARPSAARSSDVPALGRSRLGPRHRAPTDVLSVPEGPGVEEPAPAPAATPPPPTRDPSEPSGRSLAVAREAPLSEDRAPAVGRTAAAVSRARDTGARRGMARGPSPGVATFAAPLAVRPPQPAVEASRGGVAGVAGASSHVTEPESATAGSYADSARVPAAPSGVAGPPGPRGERGPVGPTGPRGDVGAAAAPAMAMSVAGGGGSSSPKVFTYSDGAPLSEALAVRTTAAMDAMALPEGQRGMRVEFRPPDVREVGNACTAVIVIEADSDIPDAVVKASPGPGLRVLNTAPDGTLHVGPLFANRRTTIPLRLVADTPGKQALEISVTSDRPEANARIGAELKDFKPPPPGARKLSMKGDGTSRDEVSLVFRETLIKEAILAVAETAGHHVRFGPNVNGRRVDGTFQAIPAEAAMRILAQEAGCTLRRVRGGFMVTRP